jgi:DNA-binding NtrC family response regulator
MDLTKIQRIKQRYDIIGNYEGLNRALDVALQVAMTDLSVLITGENGVGKEVFPRLIHDNSARKSKKYFAVNCGSIPEGTIDSELFGHEKGAFTGAIGEREGYFGVANGGTLFLDEVGELPLSTQARLLRVLETGEYIRVGASDVRKTDVRIVAATNVDMAKAISEGKFRQDLYYRLNTIPISIPALRERGEDVYLLFRKFALEMSEKYKMPAIYLTDEAKKVLMSYSWPGNVRQLKNITENMSITSEDREISAGILRRYLPEDPHRGQLVTVSNDSAGHSFENEREILYQILFDLRRDVSELKRIVREQQTQGTSNVPAREYRYVTAEGSILPPEQSKTEVTEKDKAKELPADEYVEESVTLDDYEREVVKRALERNMGRRKETARALGISERTLYRKIKEYGLE